MNDRILNESIKSLFQKLEETGILLDEEKLLSLIRGSQKRLAERKQRINREVGFIVDLYSTGSLNRAVCKMGVTDSIFVERLLEARAISSLIRKLQQVYDLANSNFRILGRPFGLYPKYGLDINGKIITVGEPSVEDFPEEVLGVVGYQDMILIKATYPNIILQDLSGDPWIIEATAMDLMKLGFVNLFEDYRVEGMGAQIFALAPCSVYLLAPDAHVDSISSIVRECLECLHPDFNLKVDVKIGKSLDKLA